MEIINMFALAILQHAGFTLISRARNGRSLWYHAVASLLSSVVWLLVIRVLVMNLDRIDLMVTYVIGSVIGGVSMHYIAMRYFEKHI